MLRPYTATRRQRRRLLLGRLGWREPDDLDAGAVRDVHGLHHVQVFAVRRRLDEQQFGRTRVVDLVERLVELTDRVRLPVDRVGSVSPALQHDLARRRRLLLRLLLGWHLHVERTAPEWL